MGTRASTPKNYRLYVIGDIHGRLDLLTRLLAMIEADASPHTHKTKRLIFLGDYIDRGLDSRGVIDRLMRSFENGLKPIFLRGNHEDCLLKFLKNDLRFTPIWLQYGGSAGIASYGVNPYLLAAGLKEADKLQHLRHELLDILPRSHRDFFENTVVSVTYGDYFFAHAGVRPAIPLAKQKPEDLMWIREDFLSYPKGMGKMIVHGHTIQPHPDVRPNRIGLDTGAYASGHLTCLVIDGTTRTFLST